MPRQQDADRMRPRGPRASSVLFLLGFTGLAVLVIPLIALVVRAPLGDIVGLLRTPEVSAAMRLSLVTSLAALTVSTLLGVPLAWILARTQIRGVSVLRAVTVLPMVMPPVVGGVALLLAFGRRGLLGPSISLLFGLTLPFTTAAAVIAATFVSMPFLVVTVEAGLRQADIGLEEAAETMGASRWRVYRQVTLPQIAPSIGAGMALSWARALGEFGATITFAGNFTGRTQTMPLAVSQLLEQDADAAYALSLVLLAVSVGVLVAFRDRLLGGAR